MYFTYDAPFSFCMAQACIPRSCNLVAPAPSGLFNTIGGGAKRATSPSRKSSALSMVRGGDSSMDTAGGNIWNYVVRLKSLRNATDVYGSRNMRASLNVGTTLYPSAHAARRDTFDRDFNRTT